MLIIPFAEAPGLRRAPVLLSLFRADEKGDLLPELIPLKPF